LYSPTAKLWYTDSKIKFTLNNVNFGTVVAVGPQGERLTYVLSFPSLSRIRLYTLSGKFVQECAVTGNIRQIGAVTKQFSRSGVYVAAMYGTSGLIGKQTIIVP
ncbi:MAG: hypothetical protein MUF22_09700, partial [Chitinispirillaceae bacterium]|nr:hypothetical protein [Chitinispirillaceae bacterium]